MSLVLNARDHIERMVAKLEGDADFKPFMTYTDADGERGYIALVLPDVDADMKADVADLMTAWLCVYRASEATFASVTWAVRDDEKTPGVQPKDDPNRIELVMLIYVGGAGDESHTARLFREGGKARLSEWEEHRYKGEVGGRFGNAMHLGMAMGADMPESGIEYCRDNQGDMEALMRPVLNAMVNARAKLAERAKGN
jgi:hypothetical protein